MDFYQSDDGRYISVERGTDRYDASGAPFAASALLSEHETIPCIVSARYLRESCTPIDATQLPWHPWNEEWFK